MKVYPPTHKTLTPGQDIETFFSRKLHVNFLLPLSQTDSKTKLNGCFFSEFKISNRANQKENSESTLGPLLH